MERPAHHRAPENLDHTKPTAAQRAGTRWGLDRVLLLHGRDGDRDLARALQRHLRHLPVVMLHDRLLSGGMVLEHLAVGPGGVTIVAGTGELPEPLRVEFLHGVFGARAELLRDGAAADRTALVAPVREHVAAVRRLIDDYAPVAGALVLGGEGRPERLRGLEVEGILVAGAKAVAELAAREGDLHDYELASLVDLLDRLCPPALL
jgi:hypothetical protein